MTPHSGTLAWKIPWTEEPGGLQRQGITLSLDRTLGLHGLYEKLYVNVYENLIDV